MGISAPSRRFGVWLGLTLTLAAASAAQDAAPPGKKEAPEDPRALERVTLDRADARVRVAEFKKAWRAAAREGPARRISLLRTFAEARSADVSKELEKALKDKDRNVRLCAVRMLGTQRDEVARKALAKIAKGGKRYDPNAAAEAVRSLGYVGYDAKTYEQFEVLFYKYKNRGVRQAVVEAVGRQKDKRAFSLLVSVLDQPNPSNPNDGNAPPPSYWKEKYDGWITYREGVIDGLEAITGKKFYNSDTALDWAEKHGKEAGIKVERKPSPWE